MTFDQRARGVVLTSDAFIPAASLNGVMQLDGSRRLHGVLVWGITPPLLYRYTFTRD